MEEFAGRVHDPIMFTQTFLHLVGKMLIIKWTDQLTWCDNWWLLTIHWWQTTWLHNWLQSEKMPSSFFWTIYCQLSLSVFVTYVILRVSQWVSGFFLTYKTKRVSDARCPYGGGGVESSTKQQGYYALPCVQLKINIQLPRLLSTRQPCNTVQNEIFYFLRNCQPHMRDTK